MREEHHNFTPSKEEIRITEELPLPLPPEYRSNFDDNHQLDVVVFSPGSNDAIASTNTALSTAAWAVSKARAIAWYPFGAARRLLNSLTLVDINALMEEMGWSLSKRRRTLDDLRGTYAALSDEHIESNRENGELKSENQQLRSERDKLQYRNIELESQISNLSQGQDFRSVGGNTEPEHGKVQNQLEILQRNLTNWVHTTCNGMNKSEKKPIMTVEKFPSDDFPQFRAELIHVWNNAVDQEMLASMPISTIDLLGAVVKYIIFRDVLLQPLNGCASGFRGNFETPLYLFMEKVNGKEARRWQAFCLSAYEETGQSNNCSPELRQQAQDEYCNFVCKLILSIVDEIAQKYTGVAADGEKLRLIVKQASQLSMLFGKLQSRLELMDLHWFQKNNLKFSSSDERMKLRFSSMYGDSESEGIIAVLLSPGLLKWGRDSGDNWENWSVWTQATVEASDLRRVGDFPLGTIASHNEFQSPSGVINKA